MRSLKEFWAFVRGTRPRPPPGPRDPVASWLFVVASVLHLPLVYLLVREAALAPAIVLAVGFLAMGLAWSGGVSLEGRRSGTTRALAAAGIAEGGLAFLPVIVDALGPVRWTFGAIALLCAGGLVRRAAGAVRTASRRS